MPAREWKDQDEIQKKKILKILRENKTPYMNIQQIAKKTGMYRDTASKYITILVKEKKITSLKMGQWDIYTIKRK